MPRRRAPRPIGAQLSPGRLPSLARAVGADCVQVFLSNPRGWAVRSGNHGLADVGMPLWVHAPYLINVASPTEEVRERSRACLEATCAAAAAVGARGVVVHGGHAGAGEPVDTGVERWAALLERYQPPVPLLVENTAGGRSAVARRVDDLGRLWERVGHRVGFCLDTCHLFASGEPDVLGALRRVLSVVGRVDLVHCNDTRDPQGSGRDRHAHLGRGAMGEELLVAMVTAVPAPVIVETPIAGIGDDLAWLRQRLG